LVILHQMLQALLRRSAWKFDSLRPAFQGTRTPSNTGCDRQPATQPHCRSYYRTYTQVKTVRKWLKMNNGCLITL